MLLLVGAVFMPDSPASVVERGMIHHARKVLRFFRRTEDVDAELQEPVETKLEMQAVARSQWRTLMTRHYRPQLIIAIPVPA